MAMSMEKIYMFILGLDVVAYYRSYCGDSDQHVHKFDSVPYVLLIYHRQFHIAMVGTSI
jgi:hypothetical protein